MKHEYHDTLVDPTPEQLISFSVVCRPKGGYGWAELCRRLKMETLDDCLPERKTWTQVVKQLLALGFEVFEDPKKMNPVVSARGTVALFRSVFSAKLKSRIREFNEGSTSYTVITVIREPESPAPSPDAIRGAIYIAVATPPNPMDPRVPPPLTVGQFSLHFPGDIAQLVNAAAVHRHGNTGKGVVVAVLDSGCYRHPYFIDNNYKITVLVAPDALDPNPLHDSTGHGTRAAANVLACAPDVSLLAVKMGTSDVVSIVQAVTSTPRPRILSLSWAYNLAGKATLDDDLIPLRFAILVALALGVTVITAGGNGDIAFPAMMPEVIAVGGMAIDETDTITKWPLSSSFISAIYPGREVPDFCGFSSEMERPTSPDAAGNVWRSGEGETSSAAPQVAGVAALLLKKKSALTHIQIKKALRKFAKTIPVATGRVGDGKLVDALHTWKKI